MWMLRGTTDSKAGALIFRLLPGAEKTAGRAVRADFIVDAPLVSRVHCRFAVDAVGRLTVSDLDSTNGTFVNGRRVERDEQAEVGDGDRVKIGRVELVAVRSVT